MATEDKGGRVSVVHSRWVGVDRGALERLAGVVGDASEVLRVDGSPHTAEALKGAYAALWPEPAVTLTPGSAAWKLERELGRPVEVEPVPVFREGAGPAGHDGPAEMMVARLAFELGQAHGMAQLLTAELRGLIARLDGDGGQAQRGETLEESCARADMKAATLQAELGELRAELQKAKALRDEPAECHGWTHTACEECYALERPGYEPHRVTSRKAERCCFCGQPTKAGIYLRAEAPEHCPDRASKGAV